MEALDENLKQMHQPVETIYLFVFQETDMVGMIVVTETTTEDTSAMTTEVSFQQNCLSISP